MVCANDVASQQQVPELASSPAAVSDDLVFGVAINGVSARAHADLCTSFLDQYIAKLCQSFDCFAVQVPFMKHVMALVFDNCGGHVDAEHTYHYHFMPLCLLEAVGVPVPENKSWFVSVPALALRPRRLALTTSLLRRWADYPDAGRLIAHWPSTGPPSPIVGWALDGHPIFGPYDARGDLVTSNRATPNSALDDCNGKDDGRG